MVCLISGSPSWSRTGRFASTVWACRIRLQRFGSMVRSRDQKNSTREQTVPSPVLTPSTSTFTSTEVQNAPLLSLFAYVSQVVDMSDYGTQEVAALSAMSSSEGESNLSLAKDGKYTVRRSRSARAGLLVSMSSSRLST